MPKVLPAILKGTAGFVTLLLLLQPAVTAQAHPADMYIQSQSIVLDDHGVLVDWKIVPGPFLADGVWATADQDQNGIISPEEAQVWVAPFLSELTVKLDGQAFGYYDVQKIHWPSSVDVLRTGEDAVEIMLSYAWPAGSQGKHAFAIHNAHFEGNSLNWFEVKSEVALSFDPPAQNNGLLQLNVYFQNATNSTPSALTAPLTYWNSGTPNLPSGFSATISKLASNLATNQSTQAPEPSAPQSNYATAVTSALIGLVKVQQFSPLFLAGAFLLSLALGSLHALTPGHGKALVGAYLVGSQGRTRDAIFLGMIVTLTHTGSVLLLGLITLLASHYILPTLIIPWLEIVSGLFIIAFGINLLLQRRGDLVSWFSKRQVERPGKVLLDIRRRQGDPIRATSRARSITRAPVTPHDHDRDLSHDSHHIHDASTHTGHSHVSPGNQVTFRSLLTLGISGGLVPCPDAIAILLVAVAVNRVLFGMLLIVAFSVGLAIVLIGIGIAMVQGVRWMGRSDLLTRFAVFTPVLSAVVVSGLGIGLTISAINSFKFTSAVLQPSSTRSVSSQSTSKAPVSASNFDIKNARLLYIASDKQGSDQLFMLPLSGGGAVQYTQEPVGITGYSISPDQKTILYTSFGAQAGSFFWAINTDGTQRRLALECPQSECSSPEWYPDGQKIAYERLDNAQEMSLPRFSIWWLDMQTGTTHPIFRDQSFASIGPKFSPDGQWLSYISIANNTMMIYHLNDNRSLSIPLGYQAAIPESWSPAGEALLYGNQADANNTSILHVKVYSMESGKTIDLGGSTGATDYYAAWSPDGQWIAIDRNVPGRDSSQTGNQVWLVKPDGTQPHVLLDDDNVSYSDLSWSPDGRYLLYSRYTLNDPNPNVGHFDVAMTDVQTGHAILLVPGGDLARLLR